MRGVTVVAEGTTDEAVALRLLGHVGLDCEAVYVQNGKRNLDKRINAYNQAARHSPWLVLRDLDQDADCVPRLLRRLLPSPATYMRFRVAVRSVEAWLMADQEPLAKFLGVPTSKIATQPEALSDPKTTLLALAAKSRIQSIRDDLLPRPGSLARVGPAYTSRLIEFVQKRWRPEAAATRSESLARCIGALERLRGHG